MNLTEKMRASALVKVLLIAALAMTARAEEIVKAPKGWDDQQQDELRVVSNGNATVTIHPWQSLQGQNADQWLSDLAQQAPDGGVLISVDKVKPETVAGAYSLMRKARFGKQEGLAVLYSCPGQRGFARLLTLDVRNGSFGDTLKGALFGEKVCKHESKGAAPDSLAASDTEKSEPTDGHASEEAVVNAGAAQLTISDKELQVLNRQIPAANRPTGASIILEERWRGFPAMLIFEAVMVPRFEGGQEISCTDWDPAGGLLVSALAKKEECKPGDDKPTDLQGFEPGRRIELAFGNISASGIDGLEGSASSISGGDLSMSLDGRIAIGQWNIAHASSTAASARVTATGKRNGLIGRYYLDGHTITIMTEEGEVLNGFIGYGTSKDGAVDALFLNGTHYWDR